MSVVKKLVVVTTVALTVFVTHNFAAAQYAANVASFASGATATTNYDFPGSALGSPARVTGTGQFDGVVSPFNPPWKPTDIVSVGEGGHLTLRLSNYAIPQAGGPEIGIFSNLGLIDVDFPNGQAGDEASSFGPPGSAAVEVSANGSSWVSLGNVVFDVPTNGYADLTDPFSPTPGSVESDFQLPFAGVLDDFNGLKYADAGGDDMLDRLAGSGGGTWIDVSSAGLPYVGFVRLSLADDGDALTGLNFEIDGVSVSRAALGGVVVPEPSSACAAMVCSLAVTMFVRRRTRWARSAPTPARPREPRLEICNGRR